MQPAQLETAGLDCAPVAMVGLVGCSRLARVALRRQCGSVGWDLDGYGRIGAPAPPVGSAGPSDHPDGRPVLQALMIILVQDLFCRKIIHSITCN